MPRETGASENHKKPRFFEGMSRHNQEEVSKHGAKKRDLSFFAQTKDVDSLDAVVKSPCTSQKTKAIAQKAVADHMIDDGTRNKSPSDRPPSFWPTSAAKPMAKLIDTMSDRLHRLTLG